MRRALSPAIASPVSRGTLSSADFRVLSRVCVGARVSAHAGARVPACARTGGGAMRMGGRSSIYASGSFLSFRPTGAIPAKVCAGRYIIFASGCAMAFHRALGAAPRRPSCPILAVSGCRPSLINMPHGAPDGFIQEPHSWCGNPHFPCERPHNAA